MAENASLIWGGWLQHEGSSYKTRGDLFWLVIVK